MPIPQFSHSFSLPIEEIWVPRDERQRRQIETEDLEHSIKARGQINPIIVKPKTRGPLLAMLKYELVAGERRLTACQKLGVDVIARLASDLSPLELQLIELEENIKRQDLEWQEIAQAIWRIHQLHHSSDSNWTMGETADSIGLSIGQVSLYLKVAGELNNTAANQRVLDAGTAREAYNIITKREVRQNASALDELIAPIELPGARAKAQVENVPAEALIENDGVRAELPAVTVVPAIIRPPLPPPVPSPAETILAASFLDWASAYQGPKFNFLHCDFPYGISFAAGPQGRGSELSVYDDSEDVYWKLLEALLRNVNKLLGLSAHVVFWYSEKHGPKTRELFTTAGFKVLRHPLIWVKSGNAGISPDSRRTPRHIYETALIAVRGDRQLAKIKADAYVSPTDKRLHPSAKPEPMLKHFLEMFVDEFTDALDPTCGSGSSIRACEALGARRVLGLEIDPQYREPALAALKTSRILREGNKSYGL